MRLRDCCHSVTLEETDSVLIRSDFFGFFCFSFLTNKIQGFPNFFYKHLSNVNKELISTHEHKISINGNTFL